MAVMRRQICDRNCFACPYEDCRLDAPPDLEEYRELDAMDKALCGKPTRPKREAYKKRYYQQNRERRLAYQREYRQKNLEKERERKRAWYYQNRDRARAVHNAYVEKNRDEINARARERRKAKRAREKEAANGGSGETGM